MSAGEIILHVVFWGAAILIIQGNPQHPETAAGAILAAGLWSGIVLTARRLRGVK